MAPESLIYNARGTPLPKSINVYQSKPQCHHAVIVEYDIATCTLDEDHDGDHSGVIVQQLDCDIIVRTWSRRDPDCCNDRGI